jgi:hypothetical protein
MDWTRWSHLLAGQITGYHTCDFFLWGYLKDCLYRIPVADIDDLKDRNVTVDVDMLQRTWMELEYRLDIVNVTNGAHVGCV